MLKAVLRLGDKMIGTIKNIIGVIPARGGSKGVMRKNVKFLCGKPLIYYTIRECFKSKHLTKTIVSTEDTEIAQIAKSFGVDVIMRPYYLAKDDTPTIDVIFHAIKKLEEKRETVDLVILLQPTSPLRTATDIDKAIELYISSSCESVISVVEAEHPPYWSLEIKNGFLKPLLGQKFLNMRRQDLPKVYFPNGAIFIARPEILKKYRSFYTNKIKPYIMPKEKSVDIDTEFDFLLAEVLMKRFFNTNCREK